ncbi:VOC family protein [Vibrio inusitatus NBRC 102082]|uniref:VOC family protein n=1 Tax=Vibrio inusitatus NBRC 102082 TaxID=1219070 RepID=A0A4Y3HQR5_9VIBR|nr:VOC family protein [Vibrio inusitatus]GEA49499.1 VOC family protein [Vibrio inusitatus NBRC 102082]
MEQLREANLHPQQMLDRVDVFAQKIAVLGRELGLDLCQFQADHIALRINDSSLAKFAHQAWSELGATISQAQINGRPIVVIAFDTPITVGAWSIDCLELPYPVPGKIYPSQDWEHIEFVIPSDKTDAQDYLQDIKQRFPTFDIDTGMKMKLSSPKGEGERLANPTIAFKKDGVCIKLHPHPLKKIVESEQE